MSPCASSHERLSPNQALQPSPPPRSLPSSSPRSRSQAVTAGLSSGFNPAMNAASCHGLPPALHTLHAQQFLIGLTRRLGFL